MAYTRNICSRATLYARRFNPSSFSYISHHRDDTDNVGKTNKRNENPCYRKIDDYLAQRRCFGTYMGNFSGPRNVFGGHRYMSTSSGEGVSNTGEFLSDITGVISEAPIDVIASQAPVMSEVAIAAADSAILVAAMQYVIDAVHQFTGLNWAASIALTTLMIRGATVPFWINQLKLAYKVSIIESRLDEIKEEMEAKGNDPEAMQEAKQKTNALFREYGVTPFTPLKGMLILGPIYISFGLAISNMAEKVPSFKNGGAFWFTDLTTPDAMYIFPVLTAVSFLIPVEFNMLEGFEGSPIGVAIAGTMKKFSRGLAVLIVPCTMFFPKAILCSWVTSNIFSFAYGSVLKLPGVKKSLGIPEMPPPPPTNTKPGA